MKKLKFIVSLTTRENDYQMEQASTAEEAAQRFGADLQILDAENDAILQSQQLLKLIQSNTEAHPDGIIFERWAEQRCRKSRGLQQLQVLPG